MPPQALTTPPVWVNTAVAPARDPCLANIIWPMAVPEPTAPTFRVPPYILNVPCGVPPDSLSIWTFCAEETVPTFMVAPFCTITVPFPPPREIWSEVLKFMTVFGPSKTNTPVLLPPEPVTARPTCQVATPVEVPLVCHT